MRECAPGGTRRALLAALAVALLGSGLWAGAAVAAPPVVTIDPTPTASYGSVEVSGTVDPQDRETYWSFEISSDGENWSGFAFDPSHVIAADEPAEKVSAEVAGLKGSTHYYVRLSATNFIEPLVNSPEPYPEFTTLAVEKPQVLAVDDAADVAYTTAAVSGEVERPANSDPAFDVNCRFEYVTDAQFAGSAFVGAAQVPCEENPIEDAGASAVSAELTGLSPGTTYHLRLVAENAGGKALKVAASTFTTLAPTVPAVTIDDPVVNTPTSGHFSGEINPGGTDPLFNTKWRFQCTPACPGLEGEIAADDESHEISVDVTLLPKKAYEVILVAENSAGQATAGPKFFSSEATLPPLVVTGGANSPTSTTASIFGSITAYGLPTTYFFEYGPTDSYGSVAPVGEDGVAGAENSPVFVSQDLTGLAPGTTYHYRLVANSSAGTEIGADRTFTAGPTNGPGRVYELLTPVNKGGANAFREAEYLASIDGNALSYAGQVAFHDNGSESAPYIPRYVAHRTADGWINKPMDPPQIQSVAGYTLRITQAVSRDGSKALTASRAALAPGAVEGDSNLYLRDTRTGEYTTIVSVPGAQFFNSLVELPAVNPHVFAGGTPDFSHLLLYAGNASFLFGAPNDRLYDFTGGKLQLVSIAPDGTTLPSGSAGGTDRETNRIGYDGSKIFFGSPQTFGVYVRINDETTRAITKTRRADKKGEIMPGEFLGASNDGKISYVFSSELTEDSDPGVYSLYRYEVESDDLELVAPVGNAFGIQVSNDGETVYFKSGQVLAPGGKPSYNNVYAYRNGTISLVAPLLGQLDATQALTFSAWASPSGRYLAFKSTSNLTGYNPASPNRCYPFDLFGDGESINCSQLYRYDADTQELACASCPRSGQPAIGSPHIGYSYDQFLGEQLPRVVNDNGQVFFDTPERLVPEDATKLRDVYEFDGENVRLISPGQ